jgi:hypothetical protein
MSFGISKDRLLIRFKGDDRSGVVSGDIDSHLFLFFEISKNPS